MEQEEFMPQNSRFEAVLLGCLGGALDIYCHMQFGTLVATQTGNILFLVAELGNSSLERTLIRLLSIVFFSIGFVIGLVIKDRAKTAFWRSYAILPLLITTAALPVLPNVYFLWVILLATSTGMVILTFTGSQIESHAYAIMMTSGNYRKMLTAWYQYLTMSATPEIKRKAVNYTLVVVSFIVGAIATVVLDSFFKAKAIWLVSVLLILIVYHYTAIVIRRGLKYDNL